METLPLRIRPATSEDISFIMNSWLKSYRESGPIPRFVAPAIYFDNHHKILQKILQRAKTFIACDPEDISHIYGYISGEFIDGILVIHFIYIKKSFRKLGIGRTLLNIFKHDGSYAACYTHHTRGIEDIAKRYNLVYHPYIVLNDYNLLPPPKRKRGRPKKVRGPDGLDIGSSRPAVILESVSKELSGKSEEAYVGTEE